MKKVILSISFIFCLFTFEMKSYAQEIPGIVLENVRVFDGYSAELSDPVNVLVVGNKISKISSSTFEDQGNLLDKSIYERINHF